MSRLRTWFRRLTRLALGSAALTLVVAVPTGWWAQRELARITADLPDDLSSLASWPLPTACTVKDPDGHTLDTFYVERRFPAKHDQLPEHVWQAFVASEDGSFLEHRGVDVMGILRAMVVNARAGHTVQGGSTLTQQVVKNTLLTPERSLERKIREAVLALRLERSLTKQQILKLYLDLVYLGSNNYGIEAAAQDYFGVPAHELTVAQAALLAGLVPAPSRMSPRVNPSEALRRRRLVLRRMVDEGYLPPEELQSLQDEPLELASRALPNPTAVDAGYLTATRREIRQAFGPGADTDGLTVVVPLDAELQAVADQAARTAVTAHLERNGPRALVARQAALPPDPGDAVCFQVRIDPGRRTVSTATRQWTPARSLWSAPAFDEATGLRRPLGEQVRAGDVVEVCEGSEGLGLDPRPWARAAIVVLHNATGEVRAMASSEPVALEGFVPALQARRQPGSAFKPFVYGAALDDGLSMVSEVVDSPISLPAGGGRTWSPKNYAGGYAGSLSLSTALAVSSNTVAVKLILRTGTAPVVKLAGELGVRSPIRTGDPTIALGTSEVTPMDLAHAYSSIARLGVHRQPTWIRRATSSTGRDRTPARPGTRVLSPGASYELVQMMSEVVRRGSGRAASVEGVRVAGKTGTTNDNVDAWFVGSTPDHTIAVWVGTDARDSLGAKETGGRAAAPAFRTVATALGHPRADWTVPDEVVLLVDRGQTVGLRRTHVPERLLPARVPRGPLPPLEGP